MSVTPTSSAARRCSAARSGDDLRPVSRVEAAGIAVGHDAVADLDPCRRPGGDGAGGTEVDVVRMGRETEHPLNPVRGRVERAPVPGTAGCSQLISLFAS